MVTSESSNQEKPKQLTLWSEGSLASHSARAGTREAIKMTVTSGRRCSELSRSPDPLGLLERMFLGSSLFTSTLYSLIWKPRATPAGRLVFRLTHSGRVIGESGSGLLGAPKTTTGDYHVKHGRKILTLSGQVKLLGLLATPNTFDGLPPKSQDGLEKEMNKHRPGRTRPCNLRDQVRLLTFEHLSRLSGTTGQLSPTWTDWFMGLPCGWTDSEQSGTVKSLLAQPSSGLLSFKPTENVGKEQREED